LILITFLLLIDLRSYSLQHLRIIIITPEVTLEKLDG